MLAKFTFAFLTVSSAILLIALGFGYGHYLDPVVHVRTVYKTKCVPETIPGSFTSNNGTITYQGTRKVIVC